MFQFLLFAHSLFLSSVFLAAIISFYFISTSLPVIPDKQNTAAQSRHTSLHKYTDMRKAAYSAVSVLGKFNHDQLPLKSGSFICYSNMCCLQTRRPELWSSGCFFSQQPYFSSMQSVDFADTSQDSRNITDVARPQRTLTL